MFMPSNREKIEWINYWWSEADRQMDRVLLIGDSVTRSLRKCLENQLIRQYAVDLFASSFSITDPLFWKHLAFFMDSSEYEYKCIVVQYGVQHGRHQNCARVQSEKEEFRFRYVRLVEFLKGYCSNIFLMTSNTNMCGPEWMTIDSETDGEVVARNDTIKDVGKQFGISVFDFYKLVQNSKCQYVDNVHLETRACIFSASCLAVFLKDNGGIYLNYKSMIERVNRAIGSGRNIIIYGTGVNGTKLYCVIGLLCEWEKVKFVQTHLEKEQWCCGKPVMCIDDIPINSRNTDVLIISSPANYEDMRSKADEMGFRNIMRYEDIMETPVK